MHFEKSLKRSTYPPWKDKYIDYAKLKQLLHDQGSDVGSAVPQDEDEEWTEKDEEAFVEELVNVQLEKVHSFQSETIEKLRDQTSNCEAKLHPIVSREAETPPKAENGDDNKDGDDKKDGEDGEDAGVELREEDKQILTEVNKELDLITKEMNELEKFSRINYTGFLKATKKHDRKRGDMYKVRPLMQVRLAALPFNKEDYSPLLFRISTMYSFIRKNLEHKSKRVSFAEGQTDSEKFFSYKFWVHPENLLELKTIILRRLPVLIFNPSALKVVDGAQKDPTITSIYFDNPKFSLYNAKVLSGANASSMRLRWYDQISENPEIICEKKTILEGDESEEQRFSTKEKHVQAFLDGQYKMEKDVKRLKERFGDESVEAKRLERTVSDIQQFVQDNELQPVLRANYTRLAFQIPGDSRVRITLDSNLALIREDALDTERPCRDPEDWHRRDIDEAQMEYPFNRIRKGEINRFPFSVLEIRVQGGKHYTWVDELMNSHLVKPAPKFSKFIHGVAQLFDDYVNAFPFWLSEVETDIRRDAQQAFAEEQDRKAKAADDESAVGSFIRARSSRDFRNSITGSLRSPPSSMPARTGATPERATAAMTRMSASVEQRQKMRTTAPVAEEDDEVEIEQNDNVQHTSSGLRSLLPGALSTSKYAQAKRDRVQLPPGVSEPSFWIKDEGPIKVESKVWLANQRTFIKWQHVSILLASLSLGLYNAANTSFSRALGIVYVVIALSTALWGYGIYMYRTHLIQRRSPKDFDYNLGPVVVCLALIVALLVNFSLKYKAAREAVHNDGLKVDPLAAWIFPALRANQSAPGQTVL